MTATVDELTVETTERTVTTLVVEGKEVIAQGTVALTLAAEGGGRLPDWTPGAHIDLHLGEYGMRQYSLCGDRRDSRTYRVAVKLDPTGRGGSRYVHDGLHVGDRLTFGGPRNSFRIYPSESYLFVAAGIGVTPMLSMIHYANRLGARWQCLFINRGCDSAVFLPELQGLVGESLGKGSLRFHDTTAGPCDLRQTMGELDGRTAVYACGPERMLQELQSMEAASPLPAPGLRVEHFTAPAFADGPRSSFVVELARSDRSLEVPADQTLLESVRAAGIRLLASCEQGLCGTCETEVLAGTPDHRDSVLEEHERTAGNCIMPCVSRSASPVLRLDL
ncbi:oxidoreductase [Kocuria sp. JC486]|uniref:PDR/VanB family oxidoreductase n=1 Tax=Kocuria sp. JC486 TaxID=1970736 RepID=UPI001424163F|nr:PDR/VanB family oxidoreductase [Kocuria sp. JC486]NHU84307.1 oxidoreductase [Kocuria sp. JC486]